MRALLKYYRADALIWELLPRLREVDPALLKETKKELQAFDAHCKRWDVKRKRRQESLPAAQQENLPDESGVDTHAEPLPRMGDV